ncbi:alpha/beta hydrolase [Aliihoeflea sp. PC F10.4]
MKKAAFLAATLLATPAIAEEREIFVEVENGPLAGMLTTPESPAVTPPVVIIPGSGLTDRDGNSPLGISAAPYRLLAEDLAAEGVPTIRVDKRGLFASTGDFGDPNAVTFDDYAADAQAWIDTAMEATGAHCAFLLGHSEGGLTALVAAQQAENLCGLILVATPSRPLGQTILTQLRADAANAPLMEDAERAVEALEAGETVDVTTMNPALGGLFSPAIQPFLIDAFGRDPASLIGNVHVPLKIVQGGRDMQIGEDDAARLAAAYPSAEFLIIPEMNHVLKVAPAGDRAGNIATYVDPDLPLATGVVEAIAEFVRSAER